MHGKCEWKFFCHFHPVMTFIYMYGLAKMSMTWPAACSRVCRFSGTKEIEFSKNFVSDNATKYPCNAAALQATLFIKCSHRKQRARF